MNNIPTLILRHRRENLKKCSLRGLETLEGLQFYTYPKKPLPSLSGYVLLTLNAPVLTRQDADHGLLLIDGTWRHSQVMYSQLKKPHLFLERSLPPEFQTAYPRRQEDCLDPSRGLASVEALFAAYCILGKDPQKILDCYHWKEEFLSKNQEILQKTGFFGFQPKD